LYYTGNAQASSPSWTGPFNGTKTGPIPWISGATDALFIQMAAMDPTTGNILATMGRGMEQIVSPPTSGTPAFNWDDTPSQGIENLITTQMNSTQSGAVEVMLGAWDRPLWLVTNAGVYPNQYYPDTGNVTQGWSSCCPRMSGPSSLPPNDYANSGFFISTTGGGPASWIPTPGFPQAAFFNGGGQSFLISATSWVWSSQFYGPWVTTNSGSTWSACTFQNNAAGDPVLVGGGGWNDGFFVFPARHMAQDATNRSSFIINNNGGGISATGTGNSSGTSLTFGLTATFTGVSSGTNLTVSNLTGTIHVGEQILDRTGNGSNVPANTVITGGGPTVWTTNNVTTASGDFIQAGVLSNTFVNAAFTGTATGTSLAISNIIGAPQNGDEIIGAGIPQSTYVTAGQGTSTLTLSQAATSSGASLQSGLFQDGVANGELLIAGTGIPAHTTIVSQTSAFPSGSNVNGTASGVYTTSGTTTVTYGTNTIQAGNGSGAAGIWGTTNGCATAMTQNSTTQTFPGYNGVQIKSVPGNAGHFIGGGLVYQFQVLPQTSALMYYTQNSGASWTQISNIYSTFSWGLGAIKPGFSYPTLYAVGWVNCGAPCGNTYTYGFWETDNMPTATPTWTSIGDGYPLSTNDFVWDLEADQTTYGTIYGAFGSSGWFYRTLH
jgi:hypothetical protein